MSTMSAAGGEEMRATAMSTAGRERWGPIGGIAFVVLSLIATFIAPSPPQASDGADKITAYFVDHRTAILLSGYLNGLSLIPIILFIAALYALLHDAEGAPGRLALMAFGAAILSGTLATLSAIVSSVLAFVGKDSDAATVRGLYAFSQMTGVFIWFPVAAWLLAASLIMLGMAGAYRWIAWLGLLGVIVGLLEGASVAKSGFFALGSILGLAAFLLFAIWILATSIVMLMRK